MDLSASGVFNVDGGEEEIINATPHALNIYREVKEAEAVITGDDGKSYVPVLEVGSVGTIRLTKAKVDANPTFVKTCGILIPCTLASSFIGHVEAPSGLLERKGILVVSMVVAQYLKQHKICNRTLYVPCTDFVKGVRVDGKIVGTTGFEVYS